MECEAHQQEVTRLKKEVAEREDVSAGPKWKLCSQYSTAVSINM